MGKGLARAFTSSAATLGGGGPAPLAPNITSVAASAYYGQVGNDSTYGIQGTITLPTTDSNYSHLKEIDVELVFPDGSKDTSAATLFAAFVGTTVTFKTPCVNIQLGSSQFITVNCYVKNDDGIASALIPASSATVVVRLSSVTNITGFGETGTRFIIDANKDRLPYLTLDFVPVLNAGQVPQVVSYGVSDDNGATWTPIGWTTISSVGQHIQFTRPAGAVGPWKVYAVTGPVPFDPTKKMTSVPTGAFTSSGVTLAALPAPAASNGITATVGAFSYQHDVEGGLYGFIAPGSYTDPTGTSTDFFVRCTVQDIDSSHNPVGPEKAHGGTQITGAGNSHTDNSEGLPLILSGQAGERFRYYVANKASSGTNDFADPTTNTLQTALWNGSVTADHFDVMFGALPAGAINLRRADATSLGSGITLDSATSKPKLNTTNLANMVLNGGFEEAAQGWALINGASISTSNFYTGSKGCLLPYSTLGASVVAEEVYHYVRPGDVYYCEAYAQSAGGSPGFAQLFVNTIGVGALSITTHTDTGGSWIKLSGVFTVPTGCSQIQLAVAAQGLTSGFYWVVDNIWLAPQTSAGPGTTPDGNGGVKIAPGIGIGIDGSGFLTVKTSTGLGSDGTGNIIIPSGAVTNSLLAALSVATANIQAGAVGATQIANAAITTAKIGSAQITTALIANGAITNALLGTAIIGTANIQNGVITDAKISDLSASKITGGTITATVSMTSPVITVNGSGWSIVMDSSNGFKVTNSSNADVFQIAGGSVLAGSSISLSGTSGFSCAASFVLRTVASSRYAELQISGNGLTAGSLKIRPLISPTGTFAPPSGTPFSRMGFIECEVNGVTSKIPFYN